MENFKADKGKAFTLHEAGSTHLFASEVFPRPQKPIIGSVRIFMPVHETYPAEKPAGPGGEPSKSGPEPERPAAARKFGNRTLKPP